MELQIRKRNGTLTDYEGDKIIKAIENAMTDVEILDTNVSEDIESEIYDLVSNDEEHIYSVEDISDIVERSLMEKGFYTAAKEYILFRHMKSKERETETAYQFLSKDFLSQYKHKNSPMPPLGNFVYYRTYSRWLPDKKRREYWWETVARVCEFSAELELNALKKVKQIDDSDINRLRQETEKMYDMIFNLKLFPSGRTLFTGGGPASKAHPLSNFNCSFVKIDSFEKFSELFAVLMVGTGVGLSVKKELIAMLPQINLDIEVIHKDYEPVPKKERKEYTEFKMMSHNIIEIEIGDSKFSWSQAMKYYFDILTKKQYSDIKFVMINYDNVRGAGERLKTFGGYSSGHEAIKKMFDKINKLFYSKRSNQKNKLYRVNSLDCVDIATIIAENVISGGVRRSALIVFCDQDDEDVIKAKNNLYYQDETGNWVSNTKILHRSLSNNTILYEKKPSREKLHEHFQTLKVSAEPGLGNFEAMKKRREDAEGANPCFEVILRDRGVCNLTEINLMGFVKDGQYNTKEMIEAQRFSAKMGYRLATVDLEIHEWDLVSKEDMLTGCSITGVMDFMNATNISKIEMQNILKRLRETARQEVDSLAQKFKTNPSKLVTVLKPSGTISQLPVVSSGMHFSHSPYYIRRVRINAKDPLCQFMKDSGFPWNPEVGQSMEEHTTAVFDFPVKAPEGRTKYDVSAIEQLEYYKMFMQYYVDGNASNTIHVREHEWEDVEQWIWDNWDEFVGVSFLSLDDSFYQLLPYESITEEHYNKLKENLPDFNPELLRKYEVEQMDDDDLIDDECASGACGIR